MKRCVEGEDRKQVALLPECLDDFVADDNPARIIEAFVEELKLGSMGSTASHHSQVAPPTIRQRC